MRSSLYVVLMSGGRVAEAATGADALLDGHTQGFSLLAANGDGAGQVSVKDTGTPANDLSNAAAADLFTNGGTSVKYVRNASAGLSTVASGDPAFWYDPSASAWRLLVEPSKTNIALQSQALGTSPWNVTSSATLTANQKVAPDGTNTGDLFTAQNTSYRSIFQTLAATNGIDYATSVFAAPGNQDAAAIEFRGVTTSVDALFDVAAGTLTSGSGAISAAWGDWYRISMTEASISTSELVIFGRGATGNTGDTVYFWQGQVEAGTVPTSPIPTTTVAVARSADQLYIAAADVPYSATVGTLYLKGTTPRDGAAAVLAQWDDGTANERVRIEYTGTNVQCVVTDGGVAVATLDLGAVSADTDVQVTLAWQADSIAASLDGGAVVTDTDTSGALPTMNTFRLGYSPAGEQGIVYVDKLVYVPERVSNANLPTWRYA